jgi:hypothetical protein
VAVALVHGAVRQARALGLGDHLAHLQRRARGASTLWRWCASMISMS